MAKGLKAKVEDLKLSFERMSARERLLVGGLGAVVLALVAVGAGYLVWSKLDDLAARNVAMRQALSDLDTHKDGYLDTQRRQAALKLAIPETPLELNTYVDQAASAVGVKIDESSEVQPAEGTRYTQRGLQIKLRKLNLSQLASLLKQLESSTTHVVQVTELTVYTRWNKHEEVDAELVVSTYEKGAPKPKKVRSRRGRRG